MRIIDFHVHYSEDPKLTLRGQPIRMGREAILEMMDRAGVDGAVMLAVAPRRGAKAARRLNDQLAGACEGNARLHGFGSVHPDDRAHALREMTRCVRTLGLHGFKLHPSSQRFDCASPHLLYVLRHAASLGVPVLIDSYAPFDDAQPGKLLRAASASPDTKLCLAHAGLHRFERFAAFGFLREDGRLPNVYFDLSATCVMFLGSPFQEQFRWVTERLGRDRLLFGSDFPTHSQEEALAAIRGFGYPSAWLPELLGGNAASLLAVAA